MKRILALTALILLIASGILYSQPNQKQIETPIPQPIVEEVEIESEPAQEEKEEPQEEPSQTTKPKVEVKAQPKPQELGRQSCPVGSYDIGETKNGQPICKLEPTGCPWGDSIPMEKCYPLGIQAEIFGLHNTYRSEDGKSILSYDSNLERSAQEKAEDLCNNQYWSHNRPDGETPWVLISKYSTYSMAGENLAKGFKTASAAMTGWKNSPTHNANMLNENWQMMGVGHYNCQIDGLEYFVAHFKRP